MPAVIVTGDYRIITAHLTINESVAQAGAALALASLVRACLVNRKTGVAVTPVYTIPPDDINTTLATVLVRIPSADSELLDHTAPTALEIEIQDAYGNPLTFPDLGAITIKKGAIPNPDPEPEAPVV